MILLQLSIFLTGWFQVRVGAFFFYCSQRWLSWLSKDHSSQHLQMARESGSFLKTQGVAGSAAESVTPVSTASVKLHCCKCKRNRKARPELCKTVLAFQEAIQECCPRDWRHLFPLTQLHLSDATGTRGLAGLPTYIFFLGISLLPPSLQNPERATYSHCADKKQDLGKQQISSCFVTFQLSLTLRCTLPLLLLQNLLCLMTFSVSSWMRIWGKGA